FLMLRGWCLRDCGPNRVPDLTDPPRRQERGRFRHEDQHQPEDYANELHDARNPGDHHADPAQGGVPTFLLPLEDQPPRSADVDVAHGEVNHGTHHHGEEENAKPGIGVSGCLPSPDLLEGDGGKGDQHSCVRAAKDLFVPVQQQIVSPLFRLRRGIFGSWYHHDLNSLDTERLFQNPSPPPPPRSGEGEQKENSLTLLPNPETAKRGCLSPPP